jgi:transposase InsO family protein
MFPIEMMCKVLGVSKSGYYSWLKRKPSKRAIENQKLMEQIRQVYKKSKGTYGSPRITEELKINYVHVSRRRVARLMRKANIRSITKKRFVVTTDSKHSYPVAPNLLNREFSVDRLGKVWVSDLTYIRTIEGWLYLTVIIDLADRRVIGWSMSNSMHTTATIIPAWRMAVRNRPITEELIFHSDRGVQYACTEFKELITGNVLVNQSMSRKGDCWDNAVAESFFKTIKTELIYRHSYATRKQAALSVFEYIETWYNTQRRHSSLNYLSPLEFAKLMFKLKIAA